MVTRVSPPSPQPLFSKECTFFYWYLYSFFLGGGATSKREGARRHSRKNGASLRRRNSFLVCFLSLPVTTANHPFEFYRRKEIGGNLFIHRSGPFKTRSPFSFLIKLFQHELAVVWATDQLKLSKKLICLLRKWTKKLFTRSIETTLPT